MTMQLDRAELVSRLITETESLSPDPLPAAFAKALLRRVDDDYLFRHRLTTLGAQIRDSFAWFLPAIAQGDIVVRVFKPETQANGYAVEGTVIETVMPDQPFIYDTLKLLMEQLGLRVLNNTRVVIPATFSGPRSGPADQTTRTVTSIGENAADAESYGYTRWYVTWEGAPTHEELAAEVRDRLAMARTMVADFHRMLRDVRATANEFSYLATVPNAPRTACTEVQDFMQWLCDDNFVFMGLGVIGRDHAGNLQPNAERSLGIARHARSPNLDADGQAFLTSSSVLEWPLARVHKSTVDSLIHRRGKVDQIIVRTFDPEGRPSGGIVIYGMFAHKGLGQPGGEIPILGGKLDRIIAAEGTRSGDYDHKSLISAFNALPVEYLFEADEDTVRNLLSETRAADDRHEFMSHIAASRDGRSAYVFVVVPKENYSDELRAQLQSMLQAELRANYADHRVHFGKYGSVGVHFYLTADASITSLPGVHSSPEKIDFGALEKKLAELGTPWVLRLRRALELEFGEAAGAEKHVRYAAAFPESYTEQTPVDVAVVDLQHLEQVIQNGRLRFDIFPSNGTEEDALLRIYSPREMLLTEILPVVDNFGVVVAEQNAWDVQPEHAPARLQINTLRVRRGDPDLLKQRSELVDALAAVFERRMRSDRINRLLLRARLTWQEVEVFRSYFYYSRQLGSTVTPEIVQKVLINHAEYATRLAELFRVRFDPTGGMAPELREAQEARLNARLLKYLDGVKGFDEDRILRMFLSLVRATVRTNFYRRRSGAAAGGIGQHYTSFKLDCSKVPDMPSPRPLYEIWVHATLVEGIHLRGGKVARGGIRWSDRLDDFRSEILGLMSTQMLKNAVIVPVGAKGGFVLKTPPEDWSEARAQADSYYEIFIRGLLDITDNLVNGQIVRPPDVVCHDDIDPYLVVAADKGTAHLSDTANRLSAEYDFWLGDAFASGGSIGYDHKIKGITAKGAWVCTQHHFRELGLDAEKDPVTVVGIGDMSGDVFGNGLLLSKTVRLIGAFDHRHIFLDPNPLDPLAGWTERKRLFDKKGSKWSDYNPDLLSPGGGVFERGAKSIALWPEVQKRLGTELTEVAGEELIRLILKAEVQLLWNGGIGTYVKASFETNADAKDPANDRVRVDANQLRCKVIGEGGNLGMTQRARVEFADLGGMVNADAIDNSGGVDLSDHEVNLKTLLQAPLQAGTLSREDRNALIVAVGDECCELVLADNFGQALALSLDAVRTRRDIWTFQHAMMWLRERLGFSRYGEQLPANPDVVKKRKEQGKGFLKPELTKLLSFSKMALSKSVISDPPGTRSEMLPFVRDYFPKAVVAQHPDALDKHFLFAEIAGTVITNRIIDAAGVTMMPLLAVATEREPTEIAAAYLIAEDLLDVRALRAELRANETVPSEAVYSALIRIEDAIAATARAMLWTTKGRVTLATRAALEGVQAVTVATSEGVAALLPERIKRLARDDAKALETAGFDVETARRLARLAWSSHAWWIALLAERSGAAPRAAATAYFAAGFGSSALDLAMAVERQGWPDRWDFIAVSPILRALFEATSNLGALVLERGEAVLELPTLKAFVAQAEEALRDRLPVSALLVLSERLRLRVASL